mgnify:CR=1 FL=1
MNLEQRKEYDRKRYAENKDILSKKRKEYYFKNKEHFLARAKTWSLNNKDKIRENKLKTKYNLTLDQYNKMLSDQNNSCKVCNIKFNINIKMITPHVDHCHTTGKIRGLLCMNCNTSLGFLKEDTKIMQKLIEYVKEHNE